MAILKPRPGFRLDFPEDEEGNAPGSYANFYTDGPLLLHLLYWPCSGLFYYMLYLLIVWVWSL